MLIKVIQKCCLSNLTEEWYVVTPTYYTQSGLERLRRGEHDRMPASTSEGYMCIVLYEEHASFHSFHGDFLLSCRALPRIRRQSKNQLIPCCTRSKVILEHSISSVWRYVIRQLMNIYIPQFTEKLLLPCLWHWNKKQKPSHIVWDTKLLQHASFNLPRSFRLSANLEQT